MIRRWAGALALAGALMLAALLLFGWLEAQRAPVVVEVTLPMEGLPPGTRLRLLHITDTHGSRPDMGRARLEAIVAQANALRPDMMLLTGDYHGGKLLTWPHMPLKDALEPLAALYAPLGVFASMGNHDQPRWTPLVMRRQPSPVLLINEHVDAGPLIVAGVQSSHHGADVRGTVDALPPDRPAIMLIHEGDFLQWREAPAGRTAGLLVLAGHTHGGQVRLPLLGYPSDWLKVRPVCRKGLCRIRGWRLFVSAGIGTTVLPLRLGVPPQMAMITLVPPGEEAVIRE